MEAVSWGAAPSELPVTNGGKMSLLPGVKNPWWAMAQSTPSQIPVNSQSDPRHLCWGYDGVALLSPLRFLTAGLGRFDRYAGHLQIVCIGSPLGSERCVTYNYRRRVYVYVLRPNVARTQKPKTTTRAMVAATLSL